jgi:hypothetical protein
MFASIPAGSCRAAGYELDLDNVARAKVAVELDATAGVDTGAAMLLRQLEGFRRRASDATV